MASVVTALMLIIIINCQIFNSLALITYFQIIVKIKVNSSAFNFTYYLLNLINMDIASYSIN